jgi:hypothetical protein
MTFKEHVEHYSKKHQAAYAANKASAGPQTSLTGSKNVVAEQHQEQVVDWVSTDGMSTVLTIAATPAPLGSVMIRAIVDSNSRTKKTESVTTPDGTDCWRMHKLNLDTSE